jgi:hypothetical protein
LATSSTPTAPLGAVAWILRRGSQLYDSSASASTSAALPASYYQIARASVERDTGSNQFFELIQNYVILLCFNPSLSTPQLRSYITSL